jgi:hypothetical protein
MVKAKAMMDELNREMKIFRTKNAIIENGLGQIANCRVPTGSTRAAVDRQWRDISVRTLDLTLNWPRIHDALLALVA